MQPADYEGLYYYQGLLFEIQARGAQIISILEGSPEGYEIRMEPLGGDMFQLQGGPANGLQARFVRDDSGKVQSIQAGEFVLERIPSEKAAQLPVVRRFPAPQINYTPEKTAIFAGLLEQALKGDGGWIDYGIPYPKYEFIQFVTAQNAVIFHGSNDQDIDLFVPKRSSMELYDRSGRGNRLAIYGTHEGLWATFFAVVDRARLRGSIRNGVAYFYNRQNEMEALYNFSINQEQLQERPWCEGVLYLLPRNVFERLELAPGVFLNEWACGQNVRPFARLLVKPEDWPFLELVQGHDDSLLIRTREIGNIIRDSALRVKLEESTLTVWLPVSEALQGIVIEYIEKQSILMPAARLKYSEIDGKIVLVHADLPPAARAQLAKSYAAFLG
jgi:hypothetical protein